MPLTSSNMLPLGTPAPPFTLPDTVSGEICTLSDLQSNKATVVMFICNHCPYVKHIIDRLIETASSYQDQGLSFIAINSNDVTHYPEDAPEKMEAFAKTHHFSFTYLYDESQEVARAYKAACTPDFFVFDQHMRLVYRGRFDASSPGSPAPVTGEDLKSALDAILQEQPVSPEQHPSIGCNIKWKA